MEKKLIRTHRDLDVYKMAFETVMQGWVLSRWAPYRLISLSP